MVLELAQTTRQNPRILSDIPAVSSHRGRVLGVGIAPDKTRDRLAMLRWRIFLRDLDDVARMDELLVGVGPFPSIPVDIAYFYYVFT